MDGSAVLCSAAGRACFESAFPVLHSGIFWADCCADSDYCEVSFNFTFALLYRLFCGSGFFIIFVVLAAVVYLMDWFSGFALVVVFITMVGVVLVLCWVIACS